MRSPEDLKLQKAALEVLQRAHGLQIIGKDLERLAGELIAMVQTPRLPSCSLDEVPALVKGTAKPPVDDEEPHGNS